MGNDDVIWQASGNDVLVHVTSSGVGFVMKNANAGAGVTSGDVENASGTKIGTWSRGAGCPN